MRNPLKLLTTIIRLPLTALPASEPPAEATPEQDQPDKGIMYTMIYQYPEPLKATLTEWFTAQGHQPAKPLTGGGGGGGYAKGRIFYEGFGYGLGSKTAEDVALGMGSGGGNTGFAIVQNDWLRIGPMVGIGGGGLGIRPPSNEEAEQSSDEAAPLMIVMTRIEIGLGIDVIIPIPKVKLMIGLRLGYRIFQSHGPQPPDLNGPFLRVMAGMKR